MNDTTNPPQRSPSVPTAQVNPLRSRADWDRQRAAALSDPGAFHGDIARRQIHWFVTGVAADSGVGSAGAWLQFDDASGRWTGWDAASGAPVTADLGAGYEPWQRAFNADDPPHWKWFEGGATNACFNEVDRHVLAGFGITPSAMATAPIATQSKTPMVVMAAATSAITARSRPLSSGQA